MKKKKRDRDRNIKVEDVFVSAEIIELNFIESILYANFTNLLMMRIIQ